MGQGVGVPLACWGRVARYLYTFLESHVRVVARTTLKLTTTDFRANVREVLVGSGMIS